MQKIEIEIGQMQTLGQMIRITSVDMFTSTLSKLVADQKLCYHCDGNTFYTIENLLDFRGKFSEELTKDDSCEPSVRLWKIPLNLTKPMFDLTAKSGGISELKNCLTGLAIRLSPQDMGTFCAITPDGDELWQLYRHHRSQSPRCSFASLAREILRQHATKLATSAKI